MIIYSASAIFAWIMHARISTTNNLCESELSLHFYMVPFVVGWKVVALWSVWHAHNFVLLHLIIISKKKVNE